MSNKLNGRADLISKMVPRDYAVGCRVSLRQRCGYNRTNLCMQRPTPGNGYLECLTDQEKCTVSFSPIQEVTEEGILTEDGELHRVDVLICATGFDVSFRPRFPIVGANNKDLRDAWAKQPYTYLSATVPEFPNYFSTALLGCSLPTETHPANASFTVINGPFGPYGHGSILPVIEIISRYVEKFITKLQVQNVKSFWPKQEAVDDFKRHRELFLKRTAWSPPCRSWFKAGTVNGPILMWPGSRLHFFEAISDPRFEVSPCTLEPCAVRPRELRGR